MGQWTTDHTPVSIHRLGAGVSAEGGEFRVGQVAGQLGAVEEFGGELGLGVDLLAEEGEQAGVVASVGEGDAAAETGGAVVGLGVNRLGVGQGGAGEVAGIEEAAAISFPGSGRDGAGPDPLLELVEGQAGITCGIGTGSGPRRAAAGIAQRQQQGGNEDHDGRYSAMVGHRMTILQDEPIVAGTDGLLGHGVPARAPSAPIRWPTLAWVCLLLAIAQVLLGGYSLGVGNQAIQIPLLRQAMDHSLFAADAMVSTTAADYPTFFFRLLAWPARWFGVEATFVILHLLTSWAILLAVVAVAKAAFRSTTSGLVAAAMLVAAHHHALGGDDLYSPGFTHTYAVFPLAIAALALAYRGRHALAFLGAGILFNLHALTGGYLLALLLAALLADRDIGSNPGHWRGAVLPPLLFCLAAAPTIVLMFLHRQSFDSQWIGLTHLRSADHSFPSSWWQAGSAEAPRFALLAGLFALSFSFVPPGGARRKTLAMMGAAGLLFAVGYVFADVFPVPVVLRAQLFRSSRLVMILWFVQIAYAAVAAWNDSRTGGARGVRWRDWLERISAGLTLLTLTLPALMPLLPLAFAIALLAAIVNGRLSALQAGLAGITLFICIAAGRDLHVPLVGWPVFHFNIPWLAVCGLAAAALALLLHRISIPPLVKVGVRGIAACAAVGLLIAIHLQLVKAPVDPWRAVQGWASENTPVDAVFLTPIYPGGFRVHSDRAVVGEWRDGTQMYFSARFALMWWERMGDLQPGLLTNSSGPSGPSGPSDPSDQMLLSRGRSLESLDDAALIALAEKYHASHIVLPTVAAARPRQLVPLYSNARYGIYLPKLLVAEVPADVPDKKRWQADERFMRETVLPNIEKYRKGDVRLSLLGAEGRPLAGVSVNIRQTRQAFGFSASIPFFEPPAAKAAQGDFQSAPVDPRELEKFLEVFNYSMIPFSGKWMYVEPAEGERHYQELDKYIAWCMNHHVGVEYHFLSGYFAAWVKTKTPAEQGEAFLRHARALAERYGDRIDAWQVVNETVLIQQSPAVFAELRKLLPNAKLGISDCAKFAPENRSAKTAELREKDMYRGLAELRWLKEQGVKVDFFGLHGHRPFGLWPDAVEMYKVLDTFAKEGVRIHITEVSVPEDIGVLGGVRGGKYTPQLQAEYYARFLTICFSHPQVDMINLWGIGPNTWQKNAGLLDANYAPKPAFDVLKKLIGETWRTNLSGATGLDGAIGFRGFCGDYDAAITLADGKIVHAQFAIRPGEKRSTYRVQVDGTGKVLVRGGE